MKGEKSNYGYSPRPLLVLICFAKLFLPVSECQYPLRRDIGVISQGYDDAGEFWSNQEMEMFDSDSCCDQTDPRVGHKSKHRRKQWAKVQAHKRLLLLKGYCDDIPRIEKGQDTIANLLQ